MSYGVRTDDVASLRKEIAELQERVHVLEDIAMGASNLIDTLANRQNLLSEQIQFQGESLLKTNETVSRLLKLLEKLIDHKSTNDS